MPATGSGRRGVAGVMLGRASDKHQGRKPRGRGYVDLKGAMLMVWRGRLLVRAVVVENGAVAMV